MHEVNQIKRKTLLKNDDVSTLITATPTAISQINSPLPSVSPSLATVTQTAVTSQPLPTSTTTSPTNDGPKRLHVTNLPFKVRDNELKTMFEVSIEQEILSKVKVFN